MPGYRKDILNDLYISRIEEEPFLYSRIEYLPTSDSDSADPETYQISEEAQELNIPEDIELEENDSLI